jgi:hypothetical protein
MYMITQFFVRPKSIYQLLIEILGMGSRKPDPQDLVNLTDPRKQFRKGTQALFFPIAVNILPQQSDFFEAGSSKFLDFIDNNIRMPAGFSAAHIGYHTIRAIIVATPHDGYKTGHLAFGDVPVIGFRKERFSRLLDIDNPAALFLYFLN